MGQKYHINFNHEDFDKNLKTVLKNLFQDRLSECDENNNPTKCSCVLLNL